MKISRAKVFFKNDEIETMTAVSEIASFARQVSFDKLVERYQSAEMSSLKSAIEVESLIAEQLVDMLSEISPHLGSNVNVLA